MGLNIDALRKKLTETQSRGNNNANQQNVASIKWFHIEDGRNIVRLLPPLDGEDFYVEVKVHYNVGNDGRKQVVCPHEMQGNPCPICDHIHELEKGSGDDKEKAKRMKPRFKYYYRVLVNGEVQVLSTGVKVFEGILSTICDPDFGDVTHPVTGRELIITREGKGLNTTYHVQGRPKENPINDYSSEYPDITVFANPRSLDDLEYFMENGEFPPFEPKAKHTDNDAPPVRQKETYAPPKPTPVTPKLDVEDMPKEDTLPDFGDNVEDSIEAEIQRILNRHSS